MIARAALLAASALSLVACASVDAGRGVAAAGDAVAQKTSAPRVFAVRDPHSAAVPDEARVTHVALDLEADFQAKRFVGTAALDVALASDADQLILDAKSLDVRRVTDGAGAPLAFTLGAADEKLGQPLVVAVTPTTRRVVVHYATRPEAEALQWLTAAQTAGKRHPFLLSQGQSILTRSWIPTQDSPGVRQTYEARIVVPEALTAVMSADMLTPKGEPAGPGKRAFRFRMDQAIPPYLIAIAIGDVAFQPLGPRTGVWAEPSVLKAAAYELAETEKMVEAAEALYGPYRWGRYDMIVLPPSFPFGGMENPKLTFLTPTMIAGDRSLTSLIAHELAHSWSGNLVTNATWDDFWLNEGFTSYFENRIMERAYGRERAAMLGQLSWQELQAEVKNLGGPTAPDTRLKIDLTGRHPDEGFSQIPYEKGSHFLRTVETTVGRERFDAWLRSYFDRFAFQPMTTERLIEDMRASLFRGDEEQRVGVERWIFQPGVPENAAVLRSDAFAKVDQTVAAFSGGGAASAVPFKSWTTQEQLHFLNALPRELPADRLAELERTFGLNAAGNNEVLFAWLQLALANRWEPAVPTAERFLTGMGRRKFVAPLFRTLMAEGAWGQTHARRIYALARPGYHPVTYGSVDEIVK